MSENWWNQLHCSEIRHNMQWDHPWGIILNSVNNLIKFTIYYWTKFVYEKKKKSSIFLCDELLGQGYIYLIHDCRTVSINNEHIYTSGIGTHSVPDIEVLVSQSITNLPVFHFEMFAEVLTMFHFVQHWTNLVEIWNDMKIWNTLEILNEKKNIYNS